MNEVELLEEPTTEAKGEITDVADKVEFIDAPNVTELVDQITPVQDEVSAHRSRGPSRIGPGRSHSG